MDSYIEKRNKRQVGAGRAVKIKHQNARALAADDMPHPGRPVRSEESEQAPAKKGSRKLIAG